MKFWKLVAPMLLFVFLDWSLPVGSHKQAFAEKKSVSCMDSGAVVELPPEIVGENTSELLLRINKIAEEHQRYKGAMVKASEEDLLVLKHQIFLLQRMAMEYIRQLAVSLLELEKKGAQPELRKQVETIYKRVVTRLWFYIGELRGEIDVTRAKRQGAEVAERLSIEYVIQKYTHRLDTFFEMSHKHITLMKHVGLDVEDVQNDFVKLLAERSDELSGRLNLAVYRIEGLDVRRKETPDDTDIVKLLIAAKKDLAVNTASLDIVLGIMKNLGLDTTAYREQLVTATRDISSGLLNTGVAMSLMEKTFQNLTGWVVEKGPHYFVKILILCFILYACRFAMRIVRVGLEKAIDSSKVNLTLLARNMIVTSASNLVMVFGILIALSQLGISLGPLLAGLGVAGFIVGFALQDTLGNFASGMMILLYRPYDVGDLVDVAGVYGKVNKMNLVSTSLLTLDNQTIVVPNNKIWGGVIKNVTAQAIRRVDMVFGISYNDDIPKAESILNDILLTHDRILDTPEPMVRLHTLGESSVDFIARPWVRVDDYWDVYWDVTRSVKLRFDEKGVSIPFPQRDVHVYTEKAIDTKAP